MIRRHATPVALAAAIATYVVLFVLLGGSGMLLRVLAPALFAAVAAIGVKLMLGRTPQEIEDDSYREDARAIADEVRRDVRRASELGRSLPDDDMRRAIERAARTVPGILDRVERDQPTSLYSSASKLRGHMRSLVGVLESYLDIMEHPDYYRDAPALAAQGKAAVLRFDEFTIESMQLLTQGDMAEYQANLDTVAPPAIPKLEA